MAGKRMTKAQIVTEIANITTEDKKTVAKIMDCLNDLVTKELGVPGLEGGGEFVVPGLVKLRVVVKKATDERQGINPHTREPMVIPAKPATRTVRASVLKILKDQVQ
jgi:nucleoid DNA-binding protein